MRTARPRSLLERNADADLWRHTLSQIPTLTGRLLYLASLRNAVTGRYEHHGLSLLFGESESDKAIRQSHAKTFQEWLATPLPEKVEDIDGCLQATHEDLREIVRHWLRAEAWSGFVPVNTLSAEKSLFSSDMRSALKVLAIRYGGGAPGHNA